MRKLIPTVCKILLAAGVSVSAGLWIYGLLLNMLGLMAGLALTIILLAVIYFSLIFIFKVEGAAQFYNVILNKLRSRK